MSLSQVFEGVTNFIHWPIQWVKNCALGFKQHNRYQKFFERASTEEESSDRQTAFDSLWTLYRQHDVKAALLVGILSSDEVNYHQFYNPGRARIAFQLGAERGDISCSIHLAVTTIKDASDTANLDQEISTLKTVADNPSTFNWRAVAEAGLSLMEHQTDDYYFIGLDFLEQAVAARDPFAHYYLGKILIAKVDEGSGDDADLERAFQLLRVAAQNIPRAAGDLGQKLFLLKKEKEEPLAIAEWLIKHPQTCFKEEGVLLLVSFFALGLTANVSLLNLAFNASALGCVHFQEVLEKPLKDETARDELETLLFKAITRHAMADDVDAQAVQAICYYRGIGTKIDLRAAYDILNNILPRIAENKRDAYEHDLMCLAFCLYQGNPEDKDNLRRQASKLACKFYRDQPEAQAILHLLGDEWAKGCPPLSELVAKSVFAAQYYTAAADVL